MTVDEQPRPADQNELLPLLVLAPRPPGSAEPLAKSTQGERSTMLYRSEFGYDCRYDGPQPQYAGRKYDREGPRKSWFGLIAVVSLLLVIGLIAVQPAARDAVGTFFIGHHSSPAPTPQPTSQGGVLGVSTGDSSSGDTSSSAAATSTPSGSASDSKTSSSQASNGAKPVTLTGSYSVAADGQATTNCTEGTAGAGICTWTINHTAGDSMTMKVSWTGNAKVSVNVGDSVGNVYYSGSSTTSPVSAPIINSGGQINITITVTQTSQTNFTVELNNQ